MKLIIVFSHLGRERFPSVTASSKNIERPIKNRSFPRPRALINHRSIDRVILLALVQQIKPLKLKWKALKSSNVR